MDTDRQKKNTKRQPDEQTNIDKYGEQADRKLTNGQKDKVRRDFYRKEDIHANSLTDRQTVSAEKCRWLSGQTDGR